MLYPHLKLNGANKVFYSFIFSSKRSSPSLISTEGCLVKERKKKKILTTINEKKSNPNRFPVGPFLHRNGHSDH